MSDTAAGPGWWIASDGKWYPPEFHPDRAAPPPATSAAVLPATSAAVLPASSRALLGLPPAADRALPEKSPPPAVASLSPLPAPAGRVSDSATPAGQAPGRPIVRQWRFWAIVALAVFVVVGGLILELGKTTASTAGSTPVSRQRPDSTARSTTTTSPTTTTTTPTTTTVAIPSAPQATAETAANALISGWSAGNRPAALSVATTTAVDTLFAVPFPPGLATDRGCSTSNPVVCTYGPPGGGPPNDPIYSLKVEQEPSGGWYVASVQILG